VTPAEALEHCAAAIQRLPAHIFEAVRALEVVISDRPTPGAIRSGVRSDSAGLFVEPDGRTLDPTDDDEPAPPAGWIVIFLDNISPLDGPGVQAIFLHEVSHALGLDDTKLEAVGF
jgi:hypothetical protein